MPANTPDVVKFLQSFKLDQGAGQQPAADPPPWQQQQPWKPPTEKPALEPVVFEVLKPEAH